jgi:hypothetical protein
MIASGMFAGRTFITRLVTPRLMAKTHCHDNLGYYFRKPLIRCAEMQDRIGTKSAMVSELVYS